MYIAQGLGEWKGGDARIFHSQADNKRKIHVVTVNIRDVRVFCKIGSLLNASIQFVH